MEWLLLAALCLVFGAVRWALSAVKEVPMSVDEHATEFDSAPPVTAEPNHDPIWDRIAG